MKKVLLATVLILVVLGLTACCPIHNWAPATCTIPQTCLRCQKTRGDAYGHTWKDATCSVPETCATCGEICGEPLEHDITNPSPVEDSVCNRCGIILEATGYPFIDGETLKLNTPYSVGNSKIELLSCEFSQWFYQYSMDFSGNNKKEWMSSLKHQAMATDGYFYKYIRENRCIEDYDYLLLCFKIKNLSQQSIDYSELLSANVMINMLPFEEKTLLRQTEYNVYLEAFSSVERPTAFFQGETRSIPAGENGTYLFLTMVPENTIKSDAPISINVAFDNVEAVFHVR